MQQKVAPLGLLKIAAIVITILYFIGTAVAGALLEIEKPMPPVVLRLHQIIPVLTLLPGTGTSCLLLRGR